MTNLVVLPDGAERAEVLAKDDGSIIVRWSEPSRGSGSEPSCCAVTLSPERRNFDVRYECAVGDWPTRYIAEVLEMLRNALRYESGVGVNVKIVERTGM